MILQKLLLMCLTVDLLVCETSHHALIAHGNKHIEYVANFYQNLLQHLMADQRYQGILMYHQDSHHPNDCQELIAVAAVLEIPIYLLDISMDFQYIRQFNNDILVVACLYTLADYNVTLHLARTLDFMRYSRIIIQVALKGNVSDLREYFQFCHRLQLLNVMVIYSDFSATRLYYMYTVFPNFELEHHYYHSAGKRTAMIFPQRLSDLKGYKLRTIADHLLPRSVEYYDAVGERHLKGYLGRFITTMAEKWNASLVMPYNVPFSVLLNYRDIRVLMHNNSRTLDISTVVSTLYPGDNYLDFSYPLELGEWCILLPMESTVPLQQLYLIIMQSKLIVMAAFLVAAFSLVFLVAQFPMAGDYMRCQWPRFLLNDVAVRGVLGQSYVYPSYSGISERLTHCMLLLAGLIISSVFGSLMFSYLTQPLPQSPIRNFEDLLRSPIKCAIAPQEFDFLKNVTNGILSKYYSAFHIMDSFEDFIELRDTLDPRYAYTATSSFMTRLSMFEKRHNLKLFRVEKEMCPQTQMQFLVALHTNSYYRQPLNSFILYVWQSGLLDYWQSMILADIRAAGILYVKPIVTLKEDCVLSLTVWDLVWIWVLYGAINLLAVIVLAVELWSFRESQSEN